jgi:hypothetical protein
MTLLYTRELVKQAAEVLGQPDLVKDYYEGRPGAYTMVDAVLRDAEYTQPEEEV